MKLLTLLIAIVVLVLVMSEIDRRQSMDDSRMSMAEHYGHGYWKAGVWNALVRPISFNTQAIFDADQFHLHNANIALSSSRAENATTPYEALMQIIRQRHLKHTHVSVLSIESNTVGEWSRETYAGMLTYAVTIRNENDNPASASPVLQINGQEVSLKDAVVFDATFPHRIISATMSANWEGSWEHASAADDNNNAGYQVMLVRFKRPCSGASGILNGFILDSGIADIIEVRRVDKEQIPKFQR